MDLRKFFPLPPISGGYLRVNIISGFAVSGFVSLLTLWDNYFFHLIFSMKGNSQKKKL